MKNLFVILLLVCTSVQAQEKLIYKRKKFDVPVIQYSVFPILDNAVTQTTFFQMDEGLKTEEHVLRKNFFDIEGYIKDPENGKLKIYLTIGVPKFANTKKDSIYNKENNRWEYRLFSKFEVKVKVEAKCAEKLLLSKDYVSSEYHNVASSYSQKNLKEMIVLNDLKNIEAEKHGEYDIHEQGIDKVIYSTLKGISNYLNYNLAYSIGESKEKFEFVTSNGHPEYQQMLNFESEITAQLNKVTLEKGLDEKLLMPHLQYLESLLIKYPPSPLNEDIRFVVTNNLAETYLLLENKEKALLYANLLIENDKRDSRGRTLIKRIEEGNFADKKIRRHTNRFAELKKLGLKIAEDKEEMRLAFFEKIERQDEDWNLEKERREALLEKAKTKRINLLDSIPYQSNPDLLAKVIENLGGSQALKSIEKIHLFSRLKIEGNKVNQTEEKWATNTNYLLKKKMPETYYEIVNGPESWTHDDRESGINAKWAKLSTYDYDVLSKNLDMVQLLTALRLDKWNDLEILNDEMYEGRLCYHLNYFEKTLNSANRTIPKSDYHIFIDKEDFHIVATEKTAFDNGNKNLFERKFFTDYQPISALNNGKIPYTINYEIEDFDGQTIYQEYREKIEVNPVFGNRIFIKEVYFGGFK